MNHRVPPLIETEHLGRSVFSGKLAKRARRQQPVPEAFLVRREDDRISVDRMDHATRAEMTELATARGRERGPAGKEFHGWAILTVAEAASNGRSVEATPLESNPYHADVCLNLPHDGDRREWQKQHSVDLAARAVWEEATPDIGPQGFTGQ